MRTALLIASLLAGSMLAGAAHAATLIARDRATIDRPEIVLGDLFLNAGEAGDTPVAPAPAPGQRVVIDGATLTALAEANGMDWRSASRLDRVVVERAGRAVEPSQIERALAKAIAKRGRAYDVELENRGASLQVPPSAGRELDVSDLDIDERARRATATVLGPERAELRVSARLYPVVDLPVLREPVMPGEPVRAEQVEWVKVRADRVQAGVATDARHLVGLTSRRPLQPGVPVQVRDMQAQVTMPKGALITIIVRTPLMTLSTQGRALEDGAMGQVIRISNNQTKTTVEATVVSPDTAMVRQGNPNLAALEIAR